MSQENKGGLLVSIGNYIYTSILGLKDDIKKSKEILITIASNNNGNIRTKRKTKN